MKIFEFYKHYKRVLVSQVNNEIKILPYNNKKELNKTNLFSVNLIISLLGVIGIILIYEYKSRFYTILNLLGYYVGACIIIFGISSTYYFCYDTNKKKLALIISYLNIILKPMIAIIRYFEEVVSESGISIFFRNEEEKKIYKFDLSSFIVGIIISIVSLVGYILYNKYNKIIGNYRYIALYIIVIYGILGINIIVASLGKHNKIIQGLGGIILLPLFLVISITAAIFKKIKIELIMKYYIEVCLSIVTSLIVCSILIGFLTPDLIDILSSINKEFITEKTLIRLVMLLILIITNKISISLIKLIFKLKIGRIPDNNKEKERDSLLKQYTLIKYIILLIATFTLKAIDYDTPINKYNNVITVYEQNYDNLSKDEKDSLQIIKNQLKEYENDKLYIDSLFYATSLFILLRTVNSVRSDQEV